MCCVRVVVLFLTVTSSPAWTFSENPVATLSPGDDLLGSDNLDSNQNDDIDNEQEDEFSKLKISMHDIVTRENENIFFFPIDRKFGNSFETLGNPEIPVEKQNVGYNPYGVNGNFGPQYPVYTYPHRYYYPSSAYAGNGGTYGYNGFGFHPWFSGNDYPMEGRYPNPSEYAVTSKKVLRKVRSSEMEDQTITSPEQDIYTTETDDGDAIASNDMKRNDFTEYKVISDKLVRKMRSSEVEDETTTTPEQDIYTTETDDGDAIASNDKRRNDFNEYEVFSEKLLRKVRSSEMEDETTTTPEQDVYTTETDYGDAIASNDMKRNDFTEYNVISDKLVRKMRSSEVEDEKTTTPEQDIYITETDDGDAIASNDMKGNDFSEYEVFSEKLLRKMRSSEVEDETTTTPEQDTSTTETADEDAFSLNNKRRNYFRKRSFKKINRNYKGNNKVMNKSLD